MSVHQPSTVYALGGVGGHQASTVGALHGKPLQGKQGDLFRFGTVHTAYVYREKRRVQQYIKFLLPYTAVHRVHRELVQWVANTVRRILVYGFGVHHVGGNAYLSLRARGNSFAVHVLRFFSSRIARCTANGLQT